MQHWVEEAARFRGRQIRCRFDGNDDEPEDQSDPGFQHIVAVFVRTLDKDSVDRDFSFQCLRFSLHVLVEIVESRDQDAVVKSGEAQAPRYSMA